MTDWAILKLPPPTPIGIMRGDTRNFIFPLLDKDGGSLDPSSSTLTFTVKTQVGGTSVFSCTNAGGDITMTTTEITVAVAAADTSSQNPGEYAYDLQEVVGGNTTTVAWGPFTIAGDVS